MSRESSDPQVTVLLPVRNGERWIGETLESLRFQTVSNFEVLVVDDGSDDGTHDVLERMRSDDSRIVPIYRRRLGLVPALNEGLRAARASLIARIDADDIALPERLERQLATFERDSGLVLLGAWASKIDEEGKVIGELRPQVDHVRLQQELPARNPFIHSSVMFRASVARECGGYRSFFEAAEDYDLWLRLAERGKIAMLPEILMKYRVHQENVTAKKAVRQLFSTRLAIKSAARRRSGAQDFPGAEGPAPDWNAIASGELYPDALVARILQFADQDLVFDHSLVSSVLTPGAIRDCLAAPLNHRERALAQVALLNISSSTIATFSEKCEYILKLLLLHPPRGLKMLLRLIIPRLRTNLTVR